MKRKNKTAGKIAYYTLMAIFLLIFIGSALYIGNYILDARQQANLYGDLAAMVENVRQEESNKPTSPPPSTDPVPNDPPADGEEPTEETEPSILPEYEAAFETNSDLVGWLTIDGTRINYPVVQSPYEKDYYLYRNFAKERNDHGCLYAREECDIAIPSDNVTIYGHHMVNGSMFTDLDLFVKKSFWEKHHNLRFDSLTQHRTYEIFAVFKTTASEGEGFPYHDFIEAATEEEFDKFISVCKKWSLYDTGITPVYGQKILCLSTCEYSRENGRLVVAAVYTPK